MPFDALKPAPPNRLEAAEVQGLASKLARTREQGVTRAAGRLAKLGDQEPLYAAALVLGLFGALQGDRRLIGAAARIGAAVALSDALKRLTKKLVKRSRPRAVSAGKGYQREGGGSASKDEQSFPSGHVAATLAAARALGRVYPQTRVAGACLVVALGGVRVAEGEHWPSDVLAGATIGLIAEAAASPLTERLLARITPQVGRRRHAS